MLSLVLVAFGGESTHAQAAPDSPREGCFQGKPLPECKTFWIFELTGQAPFASTVTRIQPQGVQGRFPIIEVPLFEPSVGVDLGMAINLSPKHAIGITFGAEVPEGRYFLRGRFRHWLSTKSSLELIPGMFRDNSAGFSGRPAFGSTLGLRLNLADQGHLSVRYDALFLSSPQTQFDPLGDASLIPEPVSTGHAVFLGVGLGSRPALWGTGALGLAYLVLAAIIVSDAR